MTPASCDCVFMITHTAAGGLREIWNDIAGGLEGHGYRIRKAGLYRAVDPSGAPAGDREGWTYLLDNHLSSPVRLLSLFWRTVSFLRRVRPRVVITAMPLANVMVPLAAAFAGVGIRVVITHHSPADTHNRALNRLDSLTGRLPCVTRIVSVSNAVSASLNGKPLSYRAKRQTIHNALPMVVEQTLEALYHDRKQRVEAGGVLQLVALGRLTYQKNYPLILRALVHAPHVALTIVGGGEDETALRELAATCGVADRVNFLGHVERRTALEVLARADAFVQVSHYEGHSLALIEAARLGVPLIVSDVPVQIEGITHPDGRACGLVTPIDDPALLGDLLNSLAASRAHLAHWGSLARELGLAAANSIMIDAYESLIDDLREGIAGASNGRDAQGKD